MRQTKPAAEEAQIWPPFCSATEGATKSLRSKSFSGGGKGLRIQISTEGHKRGSLQIFSRISPSSSSPLPCALSRQPQKLIKKEGNSKIQRRRQQALETMCRRKREREVALCFGVWTGTKADSLQMEDKEIKKERDREVGGGGDLSCF